MSTESFRVQDDPRVIELTEKLNAARPALSRVLSELASARERLAIAVGEADLAEALAEIGEGPEPLAKRARAEAVEAEGEVSLLEAELARKEALQEALSQRLVEAEEAAATAIKARLRVRMAEGLRGLDEALQAAMAANEVVLRLEADLFQAGFRYPLLAWDSLRVTPYMHQDPGPRTLFDSSSEIGMSAYQKWRRHCERNGYGLADE